MNERIKELYNKVVGDDKLNRIFYFDSYLAGKFAELIVRECIDAVSDCSVEYCTRPQIISEIKQHFGVEE